MMYIMGEKNTQAFHLGDAIQVHADLVVEVQADGDELNHILNTMTGLPQTEKRVQRWFGDDAKFIVGNW